MLSAPERLAALERSGLLERSVDQRLSSLAYTATRLLDADACLINALDEHTQWTVSGWPPGSLPQKMAVEVTGCQEVIASGQPLVIPNTDLHPSFCGLPWTKQFRAYIGVPICYEFQAIGSMCVLGETPREWTPYDLKGLEGLANLVVLSLETEPE